MCLIEWCTIHRYEAVGIRFSHTQILIKPHEKLIVCAVLMDLKSKNKRQEVLVQSVHFDTVIHL